MDDNKIHVEESRLGEGEMLTCVPYLGLDYFGVYFNASGGKFYSDS